MIVPRDERAGRAQDIPAASQIICLTLFANSMLVSSLRRVCGSKYHTSATTHQDVMSRTRYTGNECSLEFQNASPNSRLYLMAGKGG